MRNIAEIHPKHVSDGSNLSVVLLSTKPAGVKFQYSGPHCLLGNNTTIIERQISTILAVYPKCEIIIVLGFQASKIYNLLKRKEYDRRVRYVYDPNFDVSNSLYSFGCGLYATTRERVLYIDGIMLFNKEAITNTERGSSVLVDYNEYTYNTPGITAANDGSAAFFTFDLIPRWGNIAFFTRDELALMEKFGLNPKYHTWYLHEAMNKAIDSGLRFMLYRPENYIIMEVLKPEDLKVKI